MCGRVLTEYLNLRRTAAQFLPRLLNYKPKQNQFVCKITTQRTETSFLRYRDFVFFPQIKIQLMDKDMGLPRRLNLNITKQASQRCFQQCQRRCALYINSEVDYVKGDSTDL